MDSTAEGRKLSATRNYVRTARAARLWHSALAIAFVALALLWLAPAFWALSTSLKTAPDQIKPVPNWIPHPFTLSNYTAVFASTAQGSILLPVVNSIAVAVLTTVLAIFVSALTAYPLARMRFPGRDTIFAVMIGCMMVPDVLNLVPLYMIMDKLGWLNTYAALVVPNIASAFGVFLLRQFFLGLPAEMEDAARIDGATSWQIFAQLVLPLSQAGLVALAIFTSRASWNDFTWPLIVMTSETRMTLPVALAMLRGAFAANSYGPIMAGSVVSAIPILIVFILANRHIVEGVQFAGMKG